MREQLRGLDSADLNPGDPGIRADGGSCHGLARASSESRKVPDVDDVSWPVADKSLAIFSNSLKTPGSRLIEIARWLGPCAFHFGAFPVFRQHSFPFRQDIHTTDPNTDANPHENILPRHSHRVDPG